jgi:hypothetical protein
MFGRAFFLKHQGKLLWLLNTPGVGEWFRYVLRIQGKRSSVGRRRIIGILPHAIFWRQEGEYVAEFRTHAKFSKRLYFAFAPLWWAFHAWDWCVADRWIPQLSFGFSTLTEYPDADTETTSVDGPVRQTYAWYSGVSWATIRGAAGSYANDTASENRFCGLVSDSNTNMYIEMNRSIFLFDTSALTSAASISAATFSVVVTYQTGAGGNVFAVNVYSSSPASNTALNVDGSDFDSFGTTPFSTEIVYSSLVSDSSTYNDFDIDTAGRNAISNTGVTKYGIRESACDASNIEPTWGSNWDSMCQGYFADNAGTAADPKLVVTYTASDPETVPYVVAYATRNLFGLRA